MKILYDYQIFSSQKYGGISRYYYELIKRMRKCGHDAVVGGKFLDNIYFLKLKKGPNYLLSRIDFPYKNVFQYYFNNFFRKVDLLFYKPDLLHATYYDPYILGRRNMPYVITVYDMIHEIFSNKYKCLQDKTLVNKTKTILNANHIISISENTKKDLVKLYGIPDEKITVIHLASSLDGINILKVKGLPKKYILFVGNRGGYKNFEFFIKAIVKVLKKNVSMHLVCAGGNKFNADEISTLSELGIVAKVKHVAFNSDNELAFLYQNALVYVIPSLYEGFGLTVLEAFSMKCPVVASNISSIPEVAGGAACYINPNSTNSISRGVNKVINDKVYRNRLIKAGLKQARKFTWDKTVTETIEVYRKVLNK